MNVIESSHFGYVWRKKLEFELKKEEVNFHNLGLMKTELPTALFGLVESSSYFWQTKSNRKQV